MARNAYGYVQAYVPLFIAFVILFAGVWAYTSFGPHTPTAKDNWTRIESIWKPKRDADLKAVSVAVANNDFNALLSAYKSLGADTRGWMDDLNNIASWDDPNATPNPNAAATTTELVQQLTGDGTAEADLLQNQMGAAKSMDDLLALRDDLNADDTALQSDFLAAETAIPGLAPLPSGEPVVALPSGSLAPSASPGASGSPGASAAPSASPTAPATATPAPSGSGSATATPAAS